MKSITAWQPQNGAVRKYLKNNPLTIQAFVSDLLSDPTHMYNAHTDWPTAIEGGTWQTNDNGHKRQHTPGTYKSVLRVLKLCRITF